MCGCVGRIEWTGVETNQAHKENQRQSSREAVVVQGRQVQHVVHHHFACSFTPSFKRSFTSPDPQFDL